MADDYPERKKRKREAELILIGMLLGILGQSIYDVLKIWYTQTYPLLPTSWVASLSAILAVTIIWGGYKISDAWGEWRKSRKSPRVSPVNAENDVTSS